MENEEMLDVLNMHFKMLEFYGQTSIQDVITILYLMFIDEYYEMYRDISFHDMDNNEIGLTDCMVKKLNTMLECLKQRTNLLRCVNISELPSKLHWIIPDDHTEYDYRVIDNVLYAENDYVSNSILYIDGIVNNNILVL
jgi:hypothetical protein